MGTRSLTRVIDASGDKKYQLINMYRQYDGYPSGHGKELAAFLRNMKVVNGLGNITGPTANGAGCLAAQIVANFKDGPGGIYLEPTSAKDCGQDYEYHVIVCGPDIKIICYDIGYPFKKKQIFKGAPLEYLEWAKEAA